MRATLIRAALLLAALALLAGCGGGGGGRASKQSNVAGCVPAGPPKTHKVSLKAPKQTVRPGEKLTAVVDTNCGSFDIALDTKRAPKTTNSFAYLARKGFYNGLSFFRIVPGFVIQGGSPVNGPLGDAGYNVDEPPPPNLAYTKGVVAMGKTSADPPGRSGSQFFVVDVADAGLSPDYALVGRVSKGIDVINRITKAGTPSGQPTQTILIKSIKISNG
jgi:peptidyl-prolyl cis-trans isomerase B (cyclophilin B)